MDDNYYLTTNRLVYSHNSSPNIRTTNLNDSSANYINKGIFLNSDISNSTFYNNGILVNEITKAISDENGVDIPNNITSNKIVYVINKVNIQNDSWNPGLKGTKPTPPTEGNANKTPYFIKRWTENSIDISSNQVQLKIYNLADTSTPVYTIGNENDFLTETGETIFFDISRNNRIDAYNNPNFDIANRGFWYSEDMQYTISFSLTSITNNLHKPLRYELRSYYNETGFGNVSDISNGSTIILENSANTNNFIYFDNLSGLPSVANNTTDMIQYTTDNKINGIPNLHLIDSGANSFTITLRYLANNYSTRFLLDEEENVLKHKFSYSPTDLYDISWNSHTTTAPSIAINGYKRDNDKWDISGLAITSAPKFIGEPMIGITLNITATNTFGTAAAVTIGTAHSTIYKFIYDGTSVDYHYSIKTSMRNIPSDFDPFATATNGADGTGQDPTPPEEYDNTINNLQLTLWNGYFYSHAGWQIVSTIKSTSSSAYGFSNAPVFSSITGDYNWTIFQYTGSNTSGTKYTYYSVLCNLSNSEYSKTDILQKNIVIFFYNKSPIKVSSSGNPDYVGNWYWINISEISSIGPSQAQQDKINNQDLFRGTTGLNGQYDNMGNNGETNYTILQTEDTKLVAGWLNKETISNGSTETYFVAIGVKKDNTTIKIKKPKNIILSQNGDVKKSLV